MTQWIERRLPLPRGAADRNRRTLVGLGNLVALILTCIDHPAAANQIFLAGDAEDLSTTDLLRRTGSGLGVPARLVPVPVALISAAAAVLGKHTALQRLLGSLRIDTTKATRLLGWRPPFTVDEGLRSAVKMPPGADCSS